MPWRKPSHRRQNCIRIGGDFDPLGPHRCYWQGMTALPYASGFPRPERPRPESPRPESPRPEAGAADHAAGRPVGNAGRVMPALAEAARRTGVPFEALFNTARVESGFDPDARARTSSATGLFQFLTSTWLDTLARHGARHGLTPSSRAEALALRRDPMAASLMAAAHMADNGAVLAERTGRQPGQVELYLAHFLGAAGASHFLERMAASPDSPAADLLPAAARANRGVFYTQGRPRSLAEVHDVFARKLGVSQGRDVAEPPIGLAGRQPAMSAAEAASAPQHTVALQSARLAYLLLADLGG